MRRTRRRAVNAIRISLGSIKDRGHLHAGLQRLSHLLAPRPEACAAAVIDPPAQDVAARTIITDSL